VQFIEKVTFKLVGNSFWFLESQVTQIQVFLKNSVSKDLQKNKSFLARGIAQ